MLERFLDWLSALPTPLTYAVLALMSALENVFPPVPADVAVALGALPLDDQLTLLTGHLEKIYPGIGTYVEGGASFSWHDDPWAGGGYPWWKPGQLTGWLPELAKPEGRIFFGGEHTSHLCRQMEGAVMSGYRA